MPIIDIHTHTFPDSIAPAAVDKLEKKASLVAVGDGTRAGLITAVEEGGLDFAVVDPVATAPRQVASINAKAPGFADPRLIYWGAMHPRIEDISAQLDTVCAQGMAGVKLHPDYQEFRADDPSVFPLYEEIQARGLVLLFHAGVDLGFDPPYGGPPDAIAHVLDAFPRLQVIAAHMGGFLMWDQVETYLVGRENLFLDTSFCVGRIPQETFLRLINHHGAEHILMGSDWPWASPKDTVDWIRGLPLPSSQIDAILGKNAAQLLGL